MALNPYVGKLVAAEIAALPIAAAVYAAGAPPIWAVAVAAVLAVCLFVVPVRDLTMWQWAIQFAHWVRRRRHHLHEVMQPASDSKRDEAPSPDPSSPNDDEEQPDAAAVDRVRMDRFTDVEINDTTHVGVLVEDHTVVTMVALWGRPYLPTLLTANRAETPNTVPLTVIAGEMKRASLGVDVDVVAEGIRSYTADPYGAAFTAFIGSRPVVGQRSATLVVRLDTHAADTTSGLMWRPNSVTAVIAATQRIVKALRQAGCRAEILTAAQMRNTTAATVGGAERLDATYHDRWATLHQPGHGYTTSYYLPADHLTPRALEDLWSIDADRTTVVVALRRYDEGVRVGALVRLVTSRPLRTTPATTLRRCTGRQWEVLVRTIPGAARLTTMLPTVELTDTLDEAVAVGPSGILIGATRDDRTAGEAGSVLIPFFDPAGPTRIAANVDDATVRQLIRRASAAGELVAVYDDVGRWSMTGASSRIWTTRDHTEQPPRPPTMVFHHISSSNPCPGARSAVAVGPPRPGYSPDVWIDQYGAKSLQLNTAKFDVPLEPVTIRGEDAATAPARPPQPSLVGSRQ
ncbi:type VII secretion protein EccE [Mycobacteroides abscessus subsp. massiliense]|uniref:type VII secretion protein EccE n=1 Tax=Mycobacteroides abscessus TaxID=36809 RepID=UPI0009D48218|nr:type VII secretion protein EccE [Mycobacteroides abscessus]SKK91677.1 type VII secretion protein EccE [Mycobacteroides abscessus subsp. massiliense]